MKFFSRLIICTVVALAGALNAQTTTRDDTSTGDQTIDDAVQAILDALTAAQEASAEQAAAAATQAAAATSAATTTQAANATPATTTTATTEETVSTLTSSALAVYKLTFEVAGETINYRPYQGGYYIAPITGGTGSLILTLTTGGVKTFYTYASFGELFVAVKGANRKVVLSATAANTVSTTTFFAIGTANEKKHLESRSFEGDVYAASLLKGYAVSADSEKDLPYGSSSANDIGVAGVSYLRAALDDGLTEDAINNNRTLAAEVTVVQTQLTDDGYTNGASTTATTSGTGAGGGAAAAASTGTTTTTPAAATTTTTTAR